MTIWKRVVYRERTSMGDRFALIERAQDSGAIRRPAAMHYTEAQVRGVLDALGETPESIEQLLKKARHEPRSE